MKRGRKKKALKTRQITLRINQSEEDILREFGETPQKAIHEIIKEAFYKTETYRILKTPWIDR